jgi:hypothetical protein
MAVSAASLERIHTAQLLGLGAEIVEIERGLDIAGQQWLRYAVNEYLRNPDGSIEVIPYLCFVVASGEGYISIDFFVNGGKDEMIATESWAMHVLGVVGESTGEQRAAATS